MKKVITIIGCLVLSVVSLFGCAKKEIDNSSNEALKNEYSQYYSEYYSKYYQEKALSNANSTTNVNSETSTTANSFSNVEISGVNEIFNDYDSAIKLTKIEAKDFDNNYAIMLYATVQKAGGFCEVGMKCYDNNNIIISNQSILMNTNGTNIGDVIKSGGVTYISRETTRIELYEPKD